MASTLVEVETKFDVAPDTVVPDLSDLPGVVGVDPPIVQHLVAAYVDTADLALLRAGITLRRRRGGSDPGWHLKLPWNDARCEVREPDTDALVVPTSLRALVRGVTRDRDLDVVATLRTTRTAVRLHGEGGSVIAEFADDLVSADCGSGHLFEPMTWREWELELTRPSVELAEAGARILCSAGAMPATAPSKLARVLRPPTPSPGPSPAYASTATVAEVVQAYLRDQVATICRLDPAVRADLPDAVHRMRVTARRLRSVLAAYDREFDSSVTEPVRTELRWLIGCLGRARDLEVLRERLGSASGPHGPLAASMVESIGRQQVEARRDAETAMQSPRYFDLLDELDALAAHPPWSERAARTAQAELVDCVRRQWRRFQKTVGRARSGGPAGRGRRLHDVRRAAKRLRYATEVARPLCGSGASGLADALADLQDILGHHHDAIVASEFVDGAAASGAGVRREARSVRRRLADEAATDETAFERAYRRLIHSADVQWLQ